MYRRPTGGLDRSELRALRLTPGLEAQELSRVSLRHAPPRRARAVGGEIRCENPDHYERPDGGLDLRRPLRRRSRLPELFEPPARSNSRTNIRMVQRAHVGKAVCKRGVEDDGLERISISDEKDAVFTRAREPSGRTEVTSRQMAR